MMWIKRKVVSPSWTWSYDGDEAPKRLVWVGEPLGEAGEDTHHPSWSYDGDEAPRRLV